MAPRKNVESDLNRVSISEVQSRPEKSRQQVSSSSERSHHATCALASDTVGTCPRERFSRDRGANGAKLSVGSVKSDYTIVGYGWFFYKKDMSPFRSIGARARSR